MLSNKPTAIATIAMVVIDIKQFVATSLIEFSLPELIWTGVIQSCITAFDDTVPIFGEYPTPECEALP